MSAVSTATARQSCMSNAQADALHGTDANEQPRVTAQLKYGGVACAERLVRRLAVLRCQRDALRERVAEGDFEWLAGAFADDQGMG